MSDKNIIMEFRGSSAIIVTHAADRTGAPLIIFNVAKQLHERFGIRCITFSLKDGPLLAEFKKFGAAWAVRDNRLQGKNIDVHSYIEGLIDEPRFALINTACCGSIYGEINKLQIPVITFIHDYTYPFGKYYLQNLYHLSDHIIYPVQFMVEQNLKDFPFNLNKTSVIPQGLYKAEMLTVDYKNLKIQYRKKMGIPEDAFVILGSGFIHPRKGIDIFINTAIQLLSESELKIPVFFIWLGGELDPNSTDDYMRFLARDITNTDNSKHIQFIKEAIDVAPFYAMSDLFFLSSREDPFPTVVIEAYAAGLPVLAIEGSSGSIEIIKKARNFYVPYSKRGEIAREILKLMSNRQRLLDAGKTGRELVSKDYDFENYVNKIVSLLEQKIDFNPNHRPAIKRGSFSSRVLNVSKKLIKKIIRKQPPKNRKTFAELVSSVKEKFNSVRKQGKSLTNWHQSLWKDKLPGEIEYWDNWLHDRNNKSLSFRLDPNSKIQDWLAIYLNRDLKVNRILDVGSGPLSNIGKRCEFCNLEIVCCDVLANEYQELLIKHGIKPPLEIHLAEGERLTSVFSENEFDIVFSNNAVDHTYDAVQTIGEMLKTTKVGGYVIIQVSEKEGEKNLYRGLHQWDCYIDDSQFMIKRRHIKEVDVGEKFRHLAEMKELSYVYTNPAGLPWDHPHIRVVLKKVKDHRVFFDEIKSDNR